jgi:hypothetical protein
VSPPIWTRRLPIVLEVDAYDIHRYPDDELPDVIAQATRFFVAVQAPVRVITLADPYSLGGVIGRIEQRMLQVARPLRAPLDAKRLYLDWAQQHLVLRDLRYYLLVWTDGTLEPGPLARVASETFQTPVRPVSDFSGGFQPRAFTGTYREGGFWGDYLAPLGDPPRRPFLRLLVGYTLRGEWSPWTLHPLLNLGSPFALAQEIYTYPAEKEELVLTNAAGALSAQLEVNAKSGNAPDTRSGRAAADCLRVQQETQAGQRLHKVGHVLLLKADTLPELDQITQTALTLMGPSLPFRLERGEQRNLLRLFGPESPGALGADLVPKWPIISQGLAVEMPFGRRTRTDTDGILLGIDEDGRYPVFYQGWVEPGSPDARARHMIVCGATGFGKTFFGNKMCLDEAVTNNAQVVVIEPQGHSRRLVAAVGPGIGRYHAINFETTTLNVLDVVHASLVRQVAHVKSLLEVLIRATVEDDDGRRQRRRVFSDEEVGALDQALGELYGNQPVLPFLSAAETPLLRDLGAKLRHIEGGSRLARRIRALLVDGSPGPVFDRPTNLPLGLDEAQVIAFNVAEVEERYRPFVYGVFMGAARRRTRRKPHEQRLLFWADEFGWLCQVPALAQAVAYEVKTVRTFNTAWVMGEQNAFLFSRNAAGRFILENTPDQIYFRQTSTALETVARFNKEFTARHLSLLRGAPRGLCVARLGREIYTVRVEANDFEYQAFGGT